MRAWRTRRQIAGKERGVVVVFSEQLYAGQWRELHQHLASVGKKLEEVGLRPQGAPNDIHAFFAVNSR